MAGLAHDKLHKLQCYPSSIRNFCVLAHVDHGKTTLVDALLASNGIISYKMAGKLRYMDSREDEQLRGITMKSSAVSLCHIYDSVPYLMNIIDSPGHIDFSSEVSTAVRLCDGAVVVVDVVEGVCPQTCAVLRQAWLENIRPVLVLNKLDRLILELKMSSLEASLHLQQTLERVNAVVAELFTHEFLSKSCELPLTTNLCSDINKSVTSDMLYDWSSGLENTDDSSLYFQPQSGNVVFASAIDGWAFRTMDFALLFSKRLKTNADMLNRFLWGDYFLHPKTKRVLKGAHAKGRKTLFVQLILDNIWTLYDKVLHKSDSGALDKVLQSLGLKMSAHDLKHKDCHMQLQALFAQWLPAARAVMDMVAQHLPSPAELPVDRVKKLLSTDLHKYNPKSASFTKLKSCFGSADSSDDAPVVVFVSKFFVAESSKLMRNINRPLTREQLADSERRQRARVRHRLQLMKVEESGVSQHQEVDIGDNAEQAVFSGALKAVASDTANDELLHIGFARIFSGTIKVGQRLYALTPKHVPVGDTHQFEPSEHKGTHASLFAVKDLYLFMGRELEEVSEVPAGNLVGIGGLENHIVKCGTLSSTLDCPAFSELYCDAAPILRVAVEPANPTEMEALVNGLKLLSQSDPCVQTSVQPTGEHVIVTAGEVHLQKCIDDLQKLFAKIDLSVSAPIVSFRETIVVPPRVDMVREATDVAAMVPSSLACDETVLEAGLVELFTADETCRIRIRALPLPFSVTQILDTSASILEELDTLFTKMITGKSTQAENSGINFEEIAGLRTSLIETFGTMEGPWSNAVDRIWSFGPRRCGPNILINRLPKYKRPSLWSVLETVPSLGFKKSRYWVHDNGVVSGFQYATMSGPLCEEPMMGVCFIIEDIELPPPILKPVSAEPKLTAAIGNCADLANGLATATNDLASTTIREAVEGLPKSSTEEPSSGRDSPVSTSSQFGPFSGQLISSIKEACRKSFQSQPQRLMSAMYSCHIQATSDVLGKLYAVLAKRNGRVLKDALREGCNVFEIDALLPVVESFGFADEIRKKTSGLASPQLRFSHWEVIEVDPFWTPNTEEEYKHFGEKADSENRARTYMNMIRRRKGQKTDEKIVEFAEKQRNLGRNK